jgi:hypothetical protein
MMFGPSDAESVNSAQSAQWRIKLFSNDELRQRMVDQTVPQAEYLGLTMPDPDLKWNAETGHYEFGAIDWAEFHNVLKGNGPCNRERLRTRVKAWDDGEWFRDALVAHADKKTPAPHKGDRHEQRMATVGSLHPQPARAGAQARRQPARAGRGDGAQQCARRLHAPQ